MEWLSEQIKKRHRVEGKMIGRRETEQAFREWYENEKEAGTIGRTQAPPPFLSDDGSAERFEDR